MKRTKEMKRTIIKEGWNIQNVADYALDHRFVVYKQIHQDGNIERWFWGATDERNLANRMAEEITDRGERIYGSILDLGE